MERRLLFTSTLLLFPLNVQIQIAIAFAVSTTALSREVGAWWDASSDYLSYLCNWNIVIASTLLYLVTAFSFSRSTATPYALIPLSLAHDSYCAAAYEH